MDHLVCQCTRCGTIYFIENPANAFIPGAGLSGFDPKCTANQIFANDYEPSGRQIISCYTCQL
jgi:hypothetical protein